MHKRTFLIGIGVGIIIGALLLELFDLGERSQKELTEIQQQLDETQLPSATPNQEASEGAEIDGTNGAEGEKANDLEQEGSNDPEVPNAPSQPESDTPEAPSIPSAPVEREPVAPSIGMGEELSESGVGDDAYILRVHYGDSITRAGNQLEEYGIIENANEFVSFFKEHDATIRAGFFLVEKGTSLEDLLQLFASHPLTESEANGLIESRGISQIR